MICSKESHSNFQTLLVNGLISLFHKNFFLDLDDELSASMIDKLFTRPFLNEDCENLLNCYVIKGFIFDS